MYVYGIYICKVRKRAHTLTQRERTSNFARTQREEGGKGGGVGGERGRARERERGREKESEDWREGGTEGGGEGRGSREREHQQILRVHFFSFFELYSQHIL
jgi:hypothetical protein